MKPLSNDLLHGHRWFKLRPTPNMNGEMAAQVYFYLLLKAFPSLEKSSSWTTAYKYITRVLFTNFILYCKEASLLKGFCKYNSTKSSTQHRLYDFDSTNSRELMKFHVYMDFHDRHERIFHPFHKLWLRLTFWRLYIVEALRSN